MSEFVYTQKTFENYTCVGNNEWCKRYINLYKHMHMVMYLNTTKQIL